MLEQVQQIAARIRDMREIDDISAESLAAQLDIPLETYLRYERGESDIPIGELYRIAGVFHVELGALLTGDNPKLHVYSIVRGGKGLSVERRKEYQYASLAFNFAHKKAEPFLVTVPPESAHAPIALNAHPGQEFDYVIKGALKVLVDGHEIELHEGDALFFDSGYEHGMKAINDEAAQFLAVIL